MAGGGSSGGSSSSSMSYGGGAGYQQPEFPVQGNPGVGWTQTPQTYTQEATPAWMQNGMNAKGQPNYFAAPWWGTDAATGQAIQQQDIMAPAYEAPIQPEPQQQQVSQDQMQQAAQQMAVDYRRRMANRNRSPYSWDEPSNNPSFDEWLANGSGAGQIW